MNEPRYARLLAKTLARRGRREPKAVDPSLCADEIELVQDTLRRLAVRRRAQRIGGAGALLLLLAATWAWPRLRSRTQEAVETAAVAPAIEIVASSASVGSMVVSGGSSVALQGETRIAPGSRLVAGQATGANLTLSTGSVVAIEPGSDVAVVGQGRAAIFKLAAGSMRANVVKLAPSEQFLVRTADSEIEVRGTSFQVSVLPPDVACADGTTTQVKVYEGTVVVRQKGREESVKKGEEWPRGCARPAIAAPAAVVVAPEPSERRADVGRVAPRTSRPADVSSNLAAQNDQFAEAMNVRRRGDVGAAIAAFDRFLAAYPASHLAENAAAERMRLLTSTDRAAARAAARQYLQKYPSGFARDEARALVASAQPASP
jgi:TolA-binding protein